MSRINRRQFTWVATSGIASAALVACSGEAVKDDLTPTQIPDVEGAPPTLAPNATPFSSEETGGEAPAENGAAAGEAITVNTLDSLAFDPAEIEAAPGQDIHVVNPGALQHDFVVDELGIATEMLNGGDEQTITVPEDAEIGQSFTYYCSVPGHREAGMEGTITIVEAGAAAPEEEEAPAEEEAAAGPAEAITVNALDSLAFDPSAFEATPGQDIHVVNAGALQHDFHCEDLGIATDMLNGGDEQTITVPDDAAPGEYEFWCTVPGHREGGMEGTVTIVEAGAAAPEEEEAPAEEESDAAAASGAVDASEVITVEATDALMFEPSEFTAAPGQTIKVINVGALQHDFVIDDWGLATRLLNRDEEEDLLIPSNVKPGASVTFYCSVPGHQAAGMQGTLTIAEAGAAEDAAASEESTPEEAPAAETTESGLALDQNAIRVAALDTMRFAPSQFSAAPGQQIHLVNPGVLVHDIVVDEWELDSGAIGSGEEAVFNIPESVEVGAEVEFYCSVPGHRESGMVGTITIVEADVAAAAAAATPTDAEAVASPADDAGVDEAASDASAVEVTTVDIAFEPTELAIAADTDVTITVTNAGVLQHDFVVEDRDVATDLLNGGDSTEIVVNLPAGEYTYFCSVPGHRDAGMEGTLTVE